jgi:O-antigen ligase
MTKTAVHLHNDILQTGAERGIPALVAWMIFIVWVFLSLLKLIKNKDPSLRPFTIAALAALLGLFIAGLFEYNFADSEITMLFLYLITIPFSLARILEKTEPQPV